MIYCVEVSTKPGLRDARGESIRRQIEALGIDAVQAVSMTDLYFLQGDLDGDQVDALIDTLLHDPVVEQARWHRIETLERESLPPDAWSVEVTLLPGVTDSVAESLLAGARLIGVTQLEQAATGQRYVLHGALSQDDSGPHCRQPAGQRRHPDLPRQRVGRAALCAPGRAGVA